MVVFTAELGLICIVSHRMSTTLSWHGPRRHNTFPFHPLTDFGPEKFASSHSQLPPFTSKGTICAHLGVLSHRTVLLALLQHGEGTADETGAEGTKHLFCRTQEVLHL